MKETVYKYQSEYENTNGCFWERSPAKFVKHFANLSIIGVSNFTTLDLGAGEGKNAVYLANLNANVIAIDTSLTALSRFSMQPNYNRCRERIKIINDDIRNISYQEETFDLIVAYGILHCLDSKEEIYSMIERIRKWLRQGGYFICATFTNKIPVPEIQSYLKENSFLEEGELEELLKGFL